jgi:hypothetical protein
MSLEAHVTPDKPPPSRFERVWLPASLILVLVVTLTWMTLLGYGITKLVELVL